MLKNLDHLDRFLDHLESGYATIDSCSTAIQPHWDHRWPTLRSGCCTV